MSLVIRIACVHDAPALARLAALDSAPVPLGDVLLAEVDGRLLAALGADGRAVADPFEATAGLVELLRLRAASSAAPRERRSLRKRVRFAAA
jgi:hypothetical protein